MLCESDKTGRVSLRHFYARRALRILPIYMAFLWFEHFELEFIAQLRKLGVAFDNS
jgi:hypothetical protein